MKKLVGFNLEDETQIILETSKAMLELLGTTTKGKVANLLIQEGYRSLFVTGRYKQLQDFSEQVKSIEETRLQAKQDGLI